MRWATDTDAWISICQKVQTGLTWRAGSELIARDAPVGIQWITDAELDAHPELVKTMSVQPPRGHGRVRLVSVEDIDLQPCGGTHVAHIGEIGAVSIVKIEKKGRLNRRVRLEFPGTAAPASH